MEIILFKNTNARLEWVFPTPEFLKLYDITQIALKDVPEGLPFWIIDDSELPEDRSTRDAWEIDETQNTPDGYGNKSNTFEEI